jgi:hypothetical protein
VLAGAEGETCSEEVFWVMAIDTLPTHFPYMNTSQGGVRSLTPVAVRDSA